MPMVTTLIYSRQRAEPKPTFFPPCPASFYQFWQISINQITRRNFLKYNLKVWKRI